MRTVGQRLLDAVLAGGTDLELLGRFMSDWLHPQGEHDLAISAAILIALRLRGESASELATVASALRETVQPLESVPPDALDTCGTGGDACSTFNISTATALVVAAAGVPVVKHGNRAVSSRTGSMDALDALGITGWHEPGWSQRALERCGIAFCLAAHHYPLLAQLADLRTRLGVRTLFNFIGPLLNPGRARYQLLGVGDSRMVKPMANALRTLGTTRAAVVAGTDGLDEVTLGATTRAFVVEGASIREEEWHAASFGLPSWPRSELRADSPAESAATIHAVLAGHPGPARDVTLANAAAALCVVGRTTDLPTGVQWGAEAIDSGAAARLVEQLRAI